MAEILVRAIRAEIEMKRIYTGNEEVKIFLCKSNNTEKEIIEAFLFTVDSKISRIKPE